MTFKELVALQRKYAKHWVAQPRFVRPKTEWPDDWEVANRWRCTNDHVNIGHTRLGFCRECVRLGYGDVPVILTSPADETGPPVREEDMKAVVEAQ